MIIIFSIYREKASRKKIHVDFRFLLTLINILFIYSVPSDSNIALTLYKFNHNLDNVSAILE